jgi:hypothetical protein
MIGGLLFLRHLCLFCNHLNTIPLHTIYCDNEGLIKKSKKLLSFRLAATASALHSEYNVLATIKSLITGLATPPTITHVHGHQDDDTDYADLPLPAQLNCDADVLATEELAERPTTCTLVPLMPAAKVQFSIGGRTVTWKLPATVRRQYRLRLLKRYMKERFCWNNDTTESVAWDTFSNAFRARYRYRTFQVKLCFLLLPTGATLHKRTPSYDPRCPACSHSDECNHHLFQCQALRGAAGSLPSLTPSGTRLKNRTQTHA